MNPTIHLESFLAGAIVGVIFSIMAGVAIGMVYAVKLLATFLNQDPDGSGGWNSRWEQLGIGKRYENNKEEKK